MKYRVTSVHECMEPHFLAKGGAKCQHRVTEEWTLPTKELCIQCAQDLLDAPNEKLSERDIQRDFGAAAVSEEQVNRILKYYNLRHQVFTALKDEVSSRKSKTTTTYAIPAEADSMLPSEQHQQSRIESYIKVTSF